MRGARLTVDTGGAETTSGESACGSPPHTWSCTHQATEQVHQKLIRCPLLSEARGTSSSPLLVPGTSFWAKGPRLVELTPQICSPYPFPVISQQVELLEFISNQPRQHSLLKKSPHTHPKIPWGSCFTRQVHITIT